jgi:hypothetical protein
LTTVAHISDESSSDNDSHWNGYSTVDTQLKPASVIEFRSTARHEPIPLQVPCQQVFHTPIQQHQYPMFSYAGCKSSSEMMAPHFSSAPFMQWQDVVVSSTAAIGGYNACPPSASIAPQPISPTSTADHILDDAVDELFSNTDGDSEDVANLDDLWDPVAFGEADEVGPIQDDLQLGHILEAFLKQY